MDTFVKAAPQETDGGMRRREDPARAAPTATPRRFAARNGLLPATGACVASALLPAFLPVEGTDYAAMVDRLLFFLLGAGAFLFLLVLVPVLMFAVRYRTEWDFRPGARVRGHFPLELSWATMALVIALLIGWRSLQDVQVESNVPEGAMVVNVIGQRFYWTFQYPELSITTTGDLHLPLGEPVVLHITSGDVVHSFWIPAYRLKRDAMPGMVTRIWFTPTKTGQYQARCAKLCGVAHYDMTATVTVLPSADFDQWVIEQQRQQGGS